MGLEPKKKVCQSSQSVLTAQLLIFSPSLMIAQVHHKRWYEFFQNLAVIDGQYLKDKRKEIHNPA